MPKAVAIFFAVGYLAICAAAWTTFTVYFLLWLFQLPAPFPWLVLAVLATAALAIFLKIRFRRQPAAIQSTTAPPLT